MSSTKSDSRRLTALATTFFRLRRISRERRARVFHFHLSASPQITMDTADLHPQVEALDDNIDDLEDALGPLLQTALSAHASKLPLLDKAKLYTLVTYAIESILFCKSHLLSENFRYF